MSRESDRVGEPAAVERNLEVSEEETIRVPGLRTDASGRGRAIWTEDNGTAIPVPPLSEQFAFFLPGVTVPPEVEPMVDGIYANDTHESADGVAPDTHLLAAKKDTELADWYLYTVIIPRTIHFEVVMRAGETSKPLDANFTLLCGNPWYDERLTGQLLVDVKAELLSEWDSLLKTDHIRFDELGTVEGAVAVDREANRVTVTKSGDAGASRTFRRARLNSRLFVTSPHMLKSAAHLAPTRTALLNAHKNSGLDGSGEIVVMSRSAFVQFLEDWKKRVAPLRADIKTP